MSNTTTQARIGYFGKIPSRGDFIKAADNLALIEVLDGWLAQTMALLAEDPRWKIGYDGAKPLDFAFIGPRKKRAIAGHIIASSDMAQRRFPFLTMSEMEIDEPTEFVSSSPIILSRLWNRLAMQGVGIVAAADPAIPLQTLAATKIELELRNNAYDAAFSDFLDMQTLGALDRMLGQAGFQGNVRQLILALGMLLQPVMASNSSRLEKSLVLPLPNDPMYRYLVAAFWMHLITPFLARADFELALFFVQLEQHPAMVLGFSGASARSLQAILDPQIGKEHHISFDHAQWVEDQLGSDFGLKKFSSYLAQPDLSLKTTLDQFATTFIGI
ncbi:type VI secretion system-associated protein TagF [Undibacterium sp.]|uniref:type VI secretion system-associated protein TagF n=1 Tax=Undibacterium sp. TaxID=1914977 RepID=UPI0025CDAD45|nr:type VI secretion system-associated protein TagF [Undibacterium sp.]